MKIIIVTTPIRPSPTSFAPVGSLSLIKYLRKNGYDDVEFHHIDANRPSYDDALARIIAAKPDVVGISSVVSTAYAYSKRLSLDIKREVTDCLVVLGGNLAASAEVLLRRTGVDLCVLGEGERIFLNVVKRAETAQRAGEFTDIPGLALLDDKGKLVNTGYEAQLTAAEVYDVDWDDLEKAAPIDLYIHPLFDADGRINHDQFKRDPRTFEAHRREKNFSMLIDGKGCVAKCTFCHRWDKGMRYVPIDIIMRRIDELIERYNVGFILFSGENFGSDKRWLDAFFNEIKKRDILWYAGGMRTKSVTPELIKDMQAAGCVAINYGMETGSKKILEVMEKKVKLEDNFNAQRWTAEAGFDTVVQLVLGMPGESPDTIQETIKFCKFSFTLNRELNPNNLSINYAQALPGTPLYEYGRRQGLIGAGAEGEEAYLLQISDRDAHDEFATLNFTDYPALICQTWRPLINIEVNYAFVRKFGIEQYRRVRRGEFEIARVPGDSGYFANPKRLEAQTASQNPSVANLLFNLSHGRFGEAIINHPVLFYHLRHFLPLLTLMKQLRLARPGYALGLLGAFLKYKTGQVVALKVGDFRYESLRRVVWNDGNTGSGDDPDMEPLRRGR